MGSENYLHVEFWVLSLFFIFFGLTEIMDLMCEGCVCTEVLCTPFLTFNWDLKEGCSGRKFIRQNRPCLHHFYKVKLSLKWKISWERNKKKKTAITALVFILFTQIYSTWNVLLPFINIFYKNWMCNTFYPASSHELITSTINSWSRAWCSCNPWICLSCVRSGVQVRVAAPKEQFMSAFL